MSLLYLEFHFAGEILSQAEKVVCIVSRTTVVNSQSFNITR